MSEENKEDKENCCGSPLKITDKKRKRKKK